VAWDFLVGRVVAVPTLTGIPGRWHASGAYEVTLRWDGVVVAVLDKRAPRPWPARNWLATGPTPGLHVGANELLACRTSPSPSIGVLPMSSRSTAPQLQRSTRPRSRRG
jgi:hypothetical protein